MGIGVVGLGSAKGIVFEVSDKDAVYGADKDTGIGEPCGDRLVVPFGVFHTAFCFHVKIPKQFNQIIDCGLGVEISRGDMITVSLDLRIVIVLLPLKASISTAFITDTLLRCIDNG